MPRKEFGLCNALSLSRGTGQREKMKNAIPKTASGGRAIEHEGCDLVIGADPAINVERSASGNICKEYCS
jgi:hypothetical protein